MTDNPFYLVEKEAPLAWVWLNRPAKKNAMNPPAWHALPEIMADLDADEAVRAVVIAAKGPAFCAGIDLLAMASELPELMEKEQKGGVKRRLMHKIAPLQETMTCIERCRKPVICAIHGYCVGAGLDMATACDVRLCSADAIFSLREAAVGIVADVGVLQRLPLIVGQGITRELAFTAADFDARRAKEILLVNAVFDDVDRLLAGARDLAMQIAGNSPLAVQASKEVLNYGVGKSVADGLRYVAAMSANIIPSDDLFEAMTAFMEKRKPNFSGK
ncbi:MAG TPA: crotonase/enoyl-CoA hydratase family protein [Desulfobacteraceae bacterium]|nr:crotonase/enoyl-CoA hydratase family protein [Deltaproteobacteria bacterium]RLB96578.1 MAG: crotonase/enoyl-CoA hydratase family protein [Deltaproteobacteria bacterium]HDI61300.1 crotonase/enoyl-CoA hydratase family protein [Desulfobacteraceae bacterium]